ncbi:type I secretion system permease/ATPase [Bradyrhizobium cenepequi]|uniref:type I secretion system permease/ATPase n=1 Tax=Bradyrhizobium cenepequi TaxID=2821403 RepID=UPI001CE328D6|nr:type I secretion system permease/ATPase [Bradyrhizobium cenepequi]MCA6110822.1 type I secretion system permease/ATPase [Bradyrhizobium cenepequi]
MKQTPPQPLAAAAVSGFKQGAVALALVSGVINILGLTAPLFMLQVYDRVLASRSIPTLLGFSVLAMIAYGFQLLLEIIRSRVLLRAGEFFDHELSRGVHEAVIRLPLQTRAPGDGLQALRDLDNVRSFLSGQGPAALFDLPWAPLYLAICFGLHVWIGLTALAGAAILTALTILTHKLSSAPVRETIQYGMERNAILDSSRRNAEVIRALGLGERSADRWIAANRKYLAANRKAGDVGNALGSTARVFRIMVQSAVLGVGGYLVIQQSATGGVMVASSVILGRALAPVDLAVAIWRSLLMARQSWARLRDLLSFVAPQAKMTPLPKPEANLTAEGVGIVAPGQTKPTVVEVNFGIHAGSALGIIGPSGSGKSTLTRVLVGAWHPAHGTVRLDGASLEQWDNESLGRHIGYLPQDVELFDGTIAENIARFDPSANPDDVVKAAKAAGVHHLILRFDNGYDTPTGEGGSALSAGQRQRIGLARALFDDPFLVVLDEPNSNLDTEGEDTVIQAIAAVRARKGIAIVVAHRPSVLGVVDLVLMMENGRARAFGPRDEILSRMMRPTSVQPGPKSSPADQSGTHSLGPLQVVTAPGDTSPAQREGGDV